nr:kinesin-like protein KIN12A [Ipomoea batatas]
MYFNQLGSLWLRMHWQTGSGKTYTLWGPPSAMVETPSTNGLQGIVPRIFQILFDNIEREHGNSEKKQISYQCHCSFLEVYNGHIGDLLDPMQRNLKIKDDTKNGFYVENLAEEYVSTCEDDSLEKFFVAFGIEQKLPILVLPPTDIQVIECEQSEAEHGLYDALYKKSLPGSGKKFPS